MHSGGAGPAACHGSKLLDSGHGSLQNDGTSQILLCVWRYVGVHMHTVRVQVLLQKVLHRPLRDAMPQIHGLTAQIKDKRMHLNLLSHCFVCLLYFAACTFKSLSYPFNCLMELAVLNIFVKVCVCKEMGNRK